MWCEWINHGYASKCPIIDEEPNANGASYLIFWKTPTNLRYGCTNHSKLSVIAHVFTIKLHYGLSEADYDKIIEWVRRILPEGDRLKENFYTSISMMKPFSLRYHKIDTCPNFCILYYLENIELTECRICGYALYKPKKGREITLVAYKKNLDTSQSLLDCKGYSYLQILLSIWHDIIHMMQWMKSWCTHPMKPKNILIWCILNFHWNQGTYILCYVQINSIHSGHLLLLILVGWWYSQFTTYHRNVYEAGFHVFIYGHTRS